MKKITILLIAVLTAIASYGQDITGQWNGILKVQGMQLRLVFNISKSDNGLSSKMDSPDQGAFGIPVTSTTFENLKLILEIANMGIKYVGELKEDTIKGSFTQGGQEFPLNLSRELIEKQAIKRPQEPTKPYPYYSENVSFQNNDANITLAGTLSLPKKEGKYPAVILITGSGPQNRDEEVFNHKPFLIIADYLTRNGIAVLRYDDRGVGESKGIFQTATTFDFASDVESAIEYLKTRKEINRSKIGLAGHSEGGIIAPIVASQNPEDVSYIIMLAGTGIRGDKLLMLQQEFIGRASGISEADLQKNRVINEKAFEIVLKSKDPQSLKAEMTEFLKENLKNIASGIPKEMTEDEFISLQVNQILSPWMINFIKFDPATVLKNVRCPVLAIGGEKDLQVPPKENLNAIKNAINEGGNKNITIKEYPDLNHLFQECKTGLPNEYAEIEQTFSSVVMEEITNWIIKQTK